MKCEKCNKEVEITGDTGLCMCCVKDALDTAIVKSYLNGEYAMNYKKIFRVTCLNIFAMSINLYQVYKFYTMRSFWLMGSFSMLCFALIFSQWKYLRAEEEYRKICKELEREAVKIIEEKKGSFC